MPEYQKKPVDIRAVRFMVDAETLRDEDNGVEKNVAGFCAAPDIDTWVQKALAKDDDGVAAVVVTGEGEDATFEVQTAEGTMAGGIGDWLIKGVEGELYPCKDSVFQATYVQV